MSATETTAAETVEQDSQECKQCSDIVATLSSDGLCDGCVAEAEATPEPSTRFDTVEDAVLAHHPEWADVIASAARAGYTEPPPWTDLRQGWVTAEQAIHDSIVKAAAELSADLAISHNAVFNPPAAAA